MLAGLKSAAVAACREGCHWLRTAVTRLSTTCADVCIGEVLSQLDTRRKIYSYFENLVECLILNHLILGCVHRLSHGLCPPPAVWAVSTVCLMGRVHRLTHGPCPPSVSWAVSTVCLMGCVHRLLYGLCPPSALWVVSTVCLMDCVHRLVSKQQ